MPVKLLLDFFQCRYIHRKAGLAFRQSNFMDVERPHRAGKNRMGSSQQSHLGIGFCRVDPVGCGNLNEGLENGIAVGKLDGFDIGLVDPAQLALPVAEPDWQGSRIEHCAQALNLHSQFSRIVVKLGDLPPLAGKRPEAQRRHAAGRAPVGFKKFVVECLDADIEGFSNLAQRSDAVFNDVAGISL